MVKNVFFKLKNLLSLDALAIFGWTCFFVGNYIIEPSWLKLTLLSAARVLPSVLVWSSPMLPFNLTSHPDAQRAPQIDQPLRRARRWEQTAVSHR